MSQQQSLLRCVYKALPRQPLCLAPFSRVRVHTIRLAGTHGYPPSKPRRGLHTAATATSSMVSSGSTLTGHSGRHYAIERVLQKKDNSPRCLRCQGCLLPRSLFASYVLVTHLCFPQLCDCEREGYTERCPRLQISSRHLRQNRHWLPPSPPATGHNTRPIDVRIQILHRRFPRLGRQNRPAA